MEHKIITAEQAISALSLIVESRELMSTGERRALMKSVVHWIRESEMERADIRCGTSHLILQFAHTIGELNRKIVRLEMQK